MKANLAVVILFGLLTAVSVGTIVSYGTNVGQGTPVLAGQFAFGSMKAPLQYVQYCDPNIDPQCLPPPSSSSY
jgi:hypothetical protein